MADFFSRLSYSIGNEDWTTEQSALDLQPEDHVLCITASGDRPLNLLIRECKRMVCIDANPIQNFLLELKIAAMVNLEYHDYLAFLGAIPGNHRVKTFQKLIPHLKPATAAFWMEHVKMIRKGVLYQGEVERLTQVTSLLAGMIRGKKIKRLFAMDNLEDQRKFVHEKWNSFFWRKMFEVILNPVLSRLIIQDPGLVNVGKTIEPGSYIYHRINTSLDRRLAKQNLLLSLILKGHVSQEAYSPYLKEKGVNAIKKHLQSIEIHTADIVSFVESIKEPTFDAFSLSDVISYLSYSDFLRLLKAIVRCAKPGARFCMRQFLSSHEIPEELASYFHRNTSLEKDLEERDNCFVYRFMVGEVLPQSAVHKQERKNLIESEVLVAK